MKLRYTPEARLDLAEAGTKHGEKLRTESAAPSKPAAEELIKSCANLKQYPYMGGSLSEKLGQRSSMRYLICGNAVIFYQVQDEAVSIIRILDESTGCIQLLFYEEG